MTMIGQRSVGRLVHASALAWPPRELANEIHGTRNTSNSSTSALSAAMISPRRRRERRTTSPRRLRSAYWPT
jgi:hypothetical protein